MLSTSTCSELVFLDLQSMFARYVYFAKLFLKGKSDLMGHFVAGEFENLQDYSSISFHSQSVKSLLVIETWIWTILNGRHRI